MSRSPLRKRTFLNLMASPIVLVVLLIGAGFLVQAAVSVHGKRLETAENLAQVKGEEEKLESRLDDVESELLYIKSEKGVEAELRTRYGVAKEGERVVVILEDEDTQQEQEQEKTPMSIWQKFLNLFR